MTRKCRKHYPRREVFVIMLLPASAAAAGGADVADGAQLTEAMGKNPSELPTGPAPHARPADGPLPAHGFT